MVISPSDAIASSMIGATIRRVVVNSPIAPVSKRRVAAVASATSTSGGEAAGS